MRIMLCRVLFLLLLVGEAMGAADVGLAGPYEQLMRQRLRESLDAMVRSPVMASKDENPGRDIWKALLLLHENKDLDQAEKHILNFCLRPMTEYLGQPVAQSRTEAVFRIYLTEKTRLLLTPRARAAIEDYAWELVTKHDRGIRPEDARKPFWEFDSSENHYVNDRRRYTQALQVLMISARHGPGVKLEGGTVGSLHQAWTAFWIRYFQARAGEGADMEIAHPGSYGMCTIGVYYDLHDLTDSRHLRELAGKFITLYWAEVASEFESRTGQRALVSTRNPEFAAADPAWATELLRCYGWHDNARPGGSLGLLPFIVSRYRPPEILRTIARNPGRGSYLATSRRALMVKSGEKGESGGIIFDQNGDGHFRRDVFRTPDYILGTMTLDPSRSYHNTGDLAQSMGVSFGSDLGSRIVVVGTGFYPKRAISGITGKGVAIIARDPNAQPGRGRFMSDGTRVFISKGLLWDNRVEDKSGWFFTRAGDAFAAILIPGGYEATSRTYIWPRRKLEVAEEKRGFFLESKDLWAPIVIQMGRAADFKDFAAFQAAVKAGKTEYLEGKLTYASASGDVYEYWAKGARPHRINGNVLDLNPAKTYDSPHLSMPHGSSKAIITCVGHDPLELDFGADSASVSR